MDMLEKGEVEDLHNCDVPDRVGVRVGDIR